MTHPTHKSIANDDFFDEDELFVEKQTQPNFHKLGENLGRLFLKAKNTTAQAYHSVKSGVEQSVLLNKQVELQQRLAQQAALLKRKYTIYLVISSVGTLLLGSIATAVLLS
ncbi:hypothetical protein [Pasteurella testudinis]|uniref:hypothetical protein n=1 Tax=Pasteurella testudinis TaxID=761 RepID=UPI0040583F95